MTARSRVQRLTPTTVCSPASIRSDALRIALDQTLLHVVDGGDGPAHLLDAAAARPLRPPSSSSTFARDLAGAIEYVAEIEQVGLVGQNLLQPKRPLLIPGARQPHRLVPGRKLHGAGAAHSLKE